MLRYPFCEHRLFHSHWRQQGYRMAYSLVHFEPHSSSLEGAACGTNLSIYWTKQFTKS